MTVKITQTPQVNTKQQQFIMMLIEQLGKYSVPSFVLGWHTSF